MVAPGAGQSGEALMPLPPLPVLEVLTEDQDTDTKLEALETNNIALWRYLAQLRDRLDGFTPSQVAQQLDMGALGVGPYSPITGVTAMASPPTPDTPTGLSATGFYKQIVLSWDLDPSPWITGWEVQRADDLAFTVNVATLTTSRSLMFWDNGLSDATAYYYRIRALTEDPANLSSFTSVVTATTLSSDATVGTLLETAALYVQRAHIQDAIINTAKIENLSVTTAKIANLAVETAKIADASILTAKIADLQVTTAKIALLAVTTALIDDLAVTNAKIANATIESAKIVSLSADKITAGTITALVKIAANQIELDGVNNVINIYDTQGSPRKRVEMGKLGAGSTDYGLKIYNSSGTVMFAANDQGVTSAGIKDNAVLTAAINALAVTTAKIDDLAIETGKLATAAVTTAKIEDEAVTKVYKATASDTITTTSTTYTDVSSMSVSVTAAAGQAVLVTGLISDSTMTNNTGGTTGHTMYMRVLRDSTELQVAEFTASNILNTQNIGGSLAVIFPEVPGAGTYTYKLQFKVANSSFTLSCAQRSITAVVFKK
jgi:hypothetical protein